MKGDMADSYSLDIKKSQLRLIDSTGVLVVSVTKLVNSLAELADIGVRLANQELKKKGSPRAH